MAAAAAESVAASAGAENTLTSSRAPSWSCRPIRSTACLSSLTACRSTKKREVGGLRLTVDAQLPQHARLRQVHLVAVRQPHEIAGAALRPGADEQGESRLAVLPERADGHGVVRAEPVVGQHLGPVRAVFAHQVPQRATAAR